MVDYAITAANVINGTNGRVRTGTVGPSAITAGQSLIMSANGTLNPAQADVLANVQGYAGVSLNPADPGQTVSYIVSGNYASGATASPGDLAVVSAATAGGLAPIADLGTGNAVQIVGIFTDTSNIRMVASGDPVIKV